MKRIFLVLVSFLLFLACSPPLKYKSIASYPAPQKALIVLDVQIDFVGPEARFSVNKAQIKPMISYINSISQEYENNHNKIIYIRNVFPKTDIANIFRNFAAIKGSEGINLDSRLNIHSSVIFDKSQLDSFSNNNFEQYLIDNQIDELTVCGVFADQCVYKTSVGALLRNYKVNFLMKGVAASNKVNIVNSAKKLKTMGAKIIE